MNDMDRLNVMGFIFIVIGLLSLLGISVTGILFGLAIIWFAKAISLWFYWKSKSGD